MTLIKGFSRKEAEILSGIGFHKLVHYDRSGLIQPARFGGSKRPVLIYSWQQIVELRTINRLRESASLQSIRKVIEFLRSNAEDPRLSSNQIVVINGECYWLNPDWSNFNGLMVKLVGNNSKSLVGQVTHYMLTFIPSLSEITQEIVNLAQESTVIDFSDFLDRSGIKAS